jgi:hypothetical protein
LLIKMKNETRLDESGRSSLGGNVTGSLGDVTQSTTSYLNFSNAIVYTSLCDSSISRAMDLDVTKRTSSWNFSLRGAISTILD